MNKIAFVTDSIWPYNKGGKEKRLFDISTYLSKDFDVHIYTMKWWKGGNIKTENGITLHAICRKYALYSKNRRSIKEGLLFGLACLYLINERWDAIEVDHMPFFPLFTTKFICLLKGKKMTAVWHEVWGKEYWIKYMGVLGFIAFLIEQCSIYMPDNIISVSEHTTKKLKTILHYKNKIATINDSVNIDQIKKITPSKTKTDIIFAGRLLSHKNIDLLLESVTIIKNKRPNIKVLIIGEGPERKKLEYLAKKLKLEHNVVFLGFLESHYEVLSLIKSTKVFALPSDREGFGIVALESLACKTPVVTINYSDNAASKLINNGVNGYISKPSAKDFAEVIYKVLKKPNKLNPTRGVEKYDSKFLIEKIAEVYRI